MIKWNEAVSDRADEDLMVQINREQDDEFCRKLRAALWAGKETCPVGVTTEPGTKRPILKLSTAWIKRNQCLRHGAYVAFAQLRTAVFAPAPERTDVDANYVYH